MKIPHILLLAVAIFSASCSKDEDAAPSLEQKSLSIAESATVIEAPSALLASEDEHAMQAAGLISMSNSLGAYTSYFNVPEGAAKSSTQISASNARVKATGDVVVYEWSDAKGNSVGYQISETSDSYAFEVFTKSTGADWVKYIGAEEKKDKSSGFLTIYDPTSVDAAVTLVSYTWGHSGDIFTFTMSSPDAFEFTLSVNKNTKAGSAVYFVGGKKQYEMAWDSAGAGSWSTFDEKGGTLSGTW